MTMRWILRFRCLFVLFLGIVMAGGCAQFKTVSTETPADPCAGYRALTEAHANLQKRLNNLRQELISSEDKREAQRIDIQRMRIALLEKEVHNRRLEARLTLFFARR